MTARTIIAAVLAVLVVATGAAAAAPGQVDERATGDDAADDQSRQGPPSELPGPVPDFVSNIHRAVSEFLSGTLDGRLGDAVAEETPGDGDDSDDERTTATAQ
jgi:hypothetical protein